MNIIFSRPSQTSKELAKQLNLKLFRHKPTVSIDTLIRWGNVDNSSLSCDKELNKAEAIKKSSNKQGFIELLREKNIPTLKAFTGTFPCIGRTRYHQKGKGFWYCVNNQDVEKAKRQGADYFTEFFNKTKEYRIHIAGGKVLLFSEKALTEDYRGSQTYIWNRDHGYTFRHLGKSEWLNNSNLMEMQRQCKKAMEILALDFGAFDVLYSNTMNRFVIIEVNTSPALSPLAIEKYCQYFEKELDNFDDDAEWL
jgi:hypothetical protein